MVPDWHEKTVVGLVIFVMCKVEFRSVKGVAEGRPLGFENPMIDANVGVTERVDYIKEDKVDACDNPVILSRGEEGRKEGGTENGNVDEVFLEVLHKTG